MFLSWLMLLVALSLSVIAAFYSIAGLAAIFAAAVVPIMIMGGILEIAKLTVTVWLHEYWKSCRWLMKLYLVPAVVLLAFITSMGIFGFLSKAHSDQSMVSGEVLAKISIYDEKIKTERDNIDANRKALKQLDEAVDQVMGRSTDERGAERAVQIRRSQQAERGRLLKEIEQSQKRITVLNEERAPIAAEVRKVEAEVGPIKYIAALVYGDNPDANILERAVRWVIIILVIVFDPLAIMMLLASTESFKWERELRNSSKDPVTQPDDTATTVVAQEIAEVLPEAVSVEEPSQRFDYLFKGNFWKKPQGWTSVGPMPARPDPAPEIYAGDPRDFQESWPEEKKQELIKVMETMFPPTTHEHDNEVDIEEDPRVKAAKRQWKAQNPDTTVKAQRERFARGEIDQLPWLGLVADNETAKAAATGFGISFPEDANKGDSFVRVDYMPNRVYKYNGNDWIQVDKNLTDNYTYDTAYIDHLIEKIGSGEYDPELLNDNEREQVAARINQTKA